MNTKFSSMITFARGPGFLSYSRLNFALLDSVAYFRTVDIAGTSFLYVVNMSALMSLGAKTVLLQAFDKTSMQNFVHFQGK